MITGCVNDCSHGFVALRNWNSDPTVIHGCLHSNRLVPTETMGKEGQGLKETLTENTSTKPTHAFPGAVLLKQSTWVQNKNLIMSKKHSNQNPNVPYLFWFSRNAF